MRSSRPDSAYQLPDPINAPPLCVVVPVPNSRFHIQAFQSQILELSFWWAWKRDDAHTARLAAQIWKDIYYKLQFVKCDEICPGGPGIEVEDQVSLHVDCNCEVKVDCCDGTQKQLVTTDMLNPTAFQKPGTNQPAPGGGSAQYCLRVFGNGRQLVPTPVSTGDVISIASATGATNDPTGPRPGLWFCESGDQFFAGNCVAFSDLVGTDPLPATKHLALIVEIAGVFYDLSAGPVVVPGGVSSIQPTLQVNDSTLSDNNGYLDVCVNVVNNQAATWSHAFDFTTGSHGWTPFFEPVAVPPQNAAVYNAGVGFQEVVDTIPSTYCEIQSPVFSARTITSVQVKHATTGATLHTIFYNDNTHVYGALSAGPGTFDDIVVVTQAGVTRILVFMGDSGSGAQLYTDTVVVISGQGTDPF